MILSIATRPDCLPEDVLDLLARLNQQKPVWVELGLQTMHEESAQIIHRGYDLACFERAVSGLRSREMDVIVHTILGLPGEGRKEVLQTIDYLNHMYSGDKAAAFAYFKRNAAGADLSGTERRTGIHIPYDDGSIY